MIHSATPWRISQGRDKVRPNEIRDANDDPIGAISPKADAVFIVRAVNHHADLVQALRAIVEEATHLRSPSVDLLRAAETARVALAKLDAQS